MLTFELVETSSLQLWECGWFETTSFRTAGSHDGEALNVVGSFIASSVFPRSFIERPDPWGAPLDRHGPVLVESLLSTAYMRVSLKQLRLDMEQILRNPDFGPMPSAAEHFAVNYWLASVADSVAFRLNRKACSEVVWSSSWLLFEEFLAISADCRSVRVAVFLFN